MKYFLFISLMLLIGCGEDEKKNGVYKKESNIPITGKSFNKKSSPTNKISDYY